MLCQQKLTEDAWRGESQLDITFFLMFAGVYYNIPAAGGWGQKVNCVAPKNNRSKSLCFPSIGGSDSTKTSHTK